MPKYRNNPITAYCPTEQRARELADADPSGRALVTRPGTLSFHLLIAQHGAGEFETLYVAPEARGRFATPVGGTIVEID